LALFVGGEDAGRALVYERRISGRVRVSVRVTVGDHAGAMSVSDVQHLMGALGELVARFDRYSADRAAGREGESGGP